VGTSRAWGRLLTPQFEDLFAQMFKKYAIRTLKASVKDELTIPKQRRYAVEIDFGKVERHVRLLLSLFFLEYKLCFRSMTRLCSKLSIV